MKKICHLFGNKFFLLLIILLASPLLAEVTLESLGVPKDSNHRFRPVQRGPASLFNSPSANKNEKVQTFMTVYCIDRSGRYSRPGDASYGDCLEGSSYDQNSTIFQRSGQKYLQMGIIFR